MNDNVEKTEAVKDMEKEKFNIGKDGRWVNSEQNDVIIYQLDKIEKL